MKIMKTLAALPALRLLAALLWIMYANAAASQCENDGRDSKRKPLPSCVKINIKEGKPGKIYKYEATNNCGNHYLYLHEDIAHGTDKTYYLNPGDTAKRKVYWWLKGIEYYRGIECCQVAENGGLRHRCDVRGN